MKTIEDPNRLWHEVYDRIDAKLLDLYLAGAPADEIDSLIELGAKIHALLWVELTEEHIEWDQTKVAEQPITLTFRR